jgi:hypothetical protein
MPNSSAQCRLVVHMRFTWLAVIVLFWMYAGGLSAETIYYAVSDRDDENYLKRTWHVGEVARFRKKRPDHVFDFYTFRRFANGTSKVVRECTSPTGDWFMLVTYDYGKNGRLTSLQTDLAMPDAQSRCERSYSVNPSGTLNKTSERIRGNDSAKSQPPVKHWMSLSELPLKPKT